MSGPLHARLLCVAALLLTLPGCSYRWHTLRGRYPSGPVSAPKVDEFACEVHLESTKAVGFSEDEAERVKSEIASALEEIIRPRHPEDFADARFRIIATLKRKGNWAYAYIVLPFVPILGGPIHRVEAKVSLELQIGDQIMKSEASERVFAGLFYNYKTREKATAKAFRTALRKAMSDPEKIAVLGGTR